jgi:redox-sensitive bicupin YhaK (pirin superfamily)
MSFTKTGPELLISARQKELGGVAIRRVLPYSKRRMIGPWIFLDHIGPAKIEAGKGFEVLPHPHINLATVTYLFEGKIVHRDSLGVVQTIEPGAINLMVAGRGVAHSERSLPDMREAGFEVHALQLWLALPEEVEEIDPAFYHHSAEELPDREAEGLRVRVMIGQGFGLSSPVKTFSPTLYAEATLSPGVRLELPDSVPERAVYVVSGSIRLNDEVVPEHTLAVCREGIPAVVVAEQASQLAIIGGAPIGPRYIWWNFVSSRAERIEQAKQDWKEGNFPPVPRETEFVPLPVFERPAQAL